MERNPNDPIGTSGTGTGMGAGSGLTGGTGASTLGAGTDSLGVTGQGADQNATTGGVGGVGGVGSSAGTWDASQVGGESGQPGGGLGSRLGSARDTAADKLGQARTAATERLGQVREKASELKSTLADKLDAGASSLRQQGHGGSAQLTGVGIEGTTAGSTSNDQLARFATPAADAMERTAQFLREGDLKATIENQVRTNPARTLLIAVGVGYLLGKALRGGDRGHA